MIHAQSIRSGLASALGLFSLLALSACNFSFSGQQAEQQQEAPAQTIEAEARQPSNAS